MIPVQHLSEADRLQDPAEPAASLPSSHRDDILCRKGEIIIYKDDPAGQDWYVAQITKVLDRHIQVSYCHTPTPPLEDYLSKYDVTVLLYYLTLRTVHQSNRGEKLAI